MAKKKTIDDLYQTPKVENKADKGDADAALLAEARERATDGATYWKDNWENAEEDLKFIAGDQWPSQIKTERELEQRPCLTNNVLPSFVDQIIGDQRQNKPSIKVSASRPGRVPNSENAETLKISNITGSKDYEIAQVFQGLIRDIENQCDADDAYDMAFDASVKSSMSYLRVRSDYLSDDTFEQDIIIECIENQFSVTIDPSAKKYDKSDMNWCLVDDLMDKKLFKKLYPDANSDPIDGSKDVDLGTWYTEKQVRVSEYFTREPVVREIALMSDGSSMYMDEIEKIIDELAEKEISIVRTRKVKTHKVWWRKISGQNILEGPKLVPSTTIPIVPVYGKSVNIKNKKIYQSAIRHSKDPQRMANYWDSAATEAVALAPKAPYIASETQIEGHPEWDDANTKNYSVLTYTKESPADPGPRREQPAATPMAEITLGMRSTDKIKATMGMFDASIGAKGNETSGKAILARQRESDVGSFPFIDNLSKSIRRLGRIIIEMIPKIYDSERIVRVLFEDGNEDFVKINEQIYDDESGEWVTINDLNVGKYSVTVTTGPAFSTQRSEAAESMMAFASAVPQAAEVIGDLIALNMDWPGAEQVSERLKKIVPPNVLSNEEREKLQEDMPEQEGPTPEQELAAKELEVQNKEAEAKMKAAEADIAEAEADMFKAQLETDDAKAALKAIEEGANSGNQDYQMVRELVAQAIAELSAA